MRHWARKGFKRNRADFVEDDGPRIRHVVGDPVADVSIFRSTPREEPVWFWKERKGPCARTKVLTYFTAVSQNRCTTGKKIEFRACCKRRKHIKVIIDKPYAKHVDKRFVVVR